MSEEFDHGEEIEIEAIGIEVSSQPIELYKVFKIANLVGGGGEAKHIISEGYVAVNGELETRKRRKMYDGDFFEFNQEYYVVVCDAPVTEPQPQSVSSPPQDKKTPQSHAKKSKPAASSQRKSSKKQDKAKVESEAKTENKEKKQNGRSSIDFF
ncbi:RNA-binding S4 domain-containing protein [Vibrio japonicus]|uniref:RNA-binding S4 domain-containing protein n=1 Tax=Vibrio japonicus TaxID=1824638 RepID=A0ABY5LPQ8_9VIBR|nr:RNA-binding S4 domain-containing protein [Vibrio japonicus]UUM32843.1 RNA-binding S4 domain-containing protein [Vibrio japonicus]